MNNLTEMGIKKDRRIMNLMTVMRKIEKPCNNAPAAIAFNKLIKNIRQKRMIEKRFIF